MSGTGPFKKDLPAMVLLQVRKIGRCCLLRVLEKTSKGTNDIKYLHTAKEKNSKMKWQSMEWEKIFANHISDKGAIFKTYKKLMQLNSKTPQKSS